MELNRAQKLMILAGLTAALLGLGLLSLGRVQAKVRASRDATYDTPVAKPSSPPTVTVHVTGEVNSPGVYTLAVGSRVAEAVSQAGGFTPLADPASINLALVLEDGQQVKVGILRSPTATVGQNSTSSSAPEATRVSAVGEDPPQIVSLNQATLAQLDTLPGIGPELAARIEDYRNQHGGFRSVDELREVKGIGEAKLEALRPYVSL